MKFKNSREVFHDSDSDVLFFGMIQTVHSEDVVNIGLLGGFTGPVESFTRGIYAITEFSASHVHQQCGILGNNLNVIPGDTIARNRLQQSMRWIVWSILNNLWQSSGRCVRVRQSRCPGKTCHCAVGGHRCLRLWDDNRNSRIACAEAWRHGIAPVPLTHPAYPFMRDGDGVVCE